MRRHTDKIMVIAILLAMLACKGNKTSSEEDIFTPVNMNGYFSVTYLKDTILLVENLIEEKYTYTLDSTIWDGKYHLKKEWQMVKSNGEYYLCREGGRDLFMSNSIHYLDSTYSDVFPSHSITIKKSEKLRPLHETTFYSHDINDQRVPNITIFYDDRYKIKKIRKWAFIIDYDINQKKMIRGRFRDHFIE